jgi:hypothetical protein
MSRQRVINDSFWRDPDFDNLTAESKFALHMLCTIPESNVIGVYRANWRVVGAYIGWTLEQMTNVLKTLEEADAIEQAPGGWVWIKCWWLHNNFKSAFAGNVRKPALKDIDQVPDLIKQKVINWLVFHDEDGVLEAPAKPLGRGLAGAPPNTTCNTTYINTTTITEEQSSYSSVSIKIPTNLQNLSEQIIKLTSCLQTHLAQNVIDEFAANMTDSSLKNPLGWLSMVVKKAQNGEFVPSKSLIAKQKNERKEGLTDAQKASEKSISEFENALKNGQDPRSKS